MLAKARTKPIREQLPATEDGACIVECLEWSHLRRVSRLRPGVIAPKRTSRIAPGDFRPFRPHLGSKSGWAHWERRSANRQFSPEIRAKSAENRPRLSTAPDLLRREITELAGVDRLENLIELLAGELISRRGVRNATAVLSSALGTPPLNSAFVQLEEIAGLALIDPAGQVKKC